MTNETDRALRDRLLDEYRQAVRSMIESDQFSRIENSSPKHAAIIIEEMISHAQRSFCAVAQRMNPDVWSPRVIDALSSAMAKGVAVSLIVVAAGEHAHLDSIPDDLRQCIRRAGRPDAIDFNFAVMDDRAVRIEHDVANDRATFCVNEAELARLARVRFDALYGAGTAI